MTISITYDKPVQVFGAPTLQLDVGASREAVYASGNASRVVYFEYVVQCADETERLGVPASQAEVVAGYTDAAIGGPGSIKLSSALPSVLANNRLYLAAIAEKNLGSPLRINPCRHCRECGSDGGVIGADEAHQGAHIGPGGEPAS